MLSCISLEDFISDIKMIQKIYCGKVWRHESENRNVLCGRDEQCAKCQGIDIGKSQALKEVEEGIEMIKQRNKYLGKSNATTELIYDVISQIQQFLKSKQESSVKTH